VIARVSTALGKVAADPQFQKKMNDLLLGVRYLDTPQFKTFFAQNDKVTLDLIRKLGLQVSGPNAPK
jgi:tripartite-type tricarboxylate transporter receptor subunit TctC